MNTESVRAEFESKLQEKFLTGDNRPAVTIYNHLDVRPANEPQWRRAPFVFGYHAPNENFDWEQASGGMRMFARYFETLARFPSRRARRY